MNLEDLKDIIRCMARKGYSPADICSFISVLPYPLASLDLPLRARLYLRLAGYYPLITLKTSKWGPITFCLVRCPKCKRLFLDYPHGYKGYFICPFCRW